jgi:hypothetical protein
MGHSVSSTKPVSYVTQEIWDEAIRLLSQAEASTEYFKTYAEARKWQDGLNRFLMKYSGTPNLSELASQSQSKGGE